MKRIAFKFLAALALTVLAVGCASKPHLLDLENAALGAGFKIITPKTPDQLAHLRKLPPDKVTQVRVDGKPYYLLPDLKNNQAYVGGPKQYQAYRQFRREQKMNAANYQPPPPDIVVVESDDLGWDGWDGWDAVGAMDE